MDKFELGDTVKVYDVIRHHANGFIGDINTFIYGRKYESFGINYMISKTGKDRVKIGGFNMKTTRMILFEKVWK